MSTKWMSFLAFHLWALSFKKCPIKQAEHWTVTCYCNCRRCRSSRAQFVWVLSRGRLRAVISQNGLLLDPLILQKFKLHLTLAFFVNYDDNVFHNMLTKILALQKKSQHVYPARTRSTRAWRACALRALGLLLADGTPTVGGGKTFWAVSEIFLRKQL